MSKKNKKDFICHKCILKSWPSLPKIQTTNRKY